MKLMYQIRHWRWKMIMYQEVEDDAVQEGIDLNGRYVNVPLYIPGSLLSFMYSSFVNVVDQ